jgi:hypothetical protein
MEEVVMRKSVCFALAAMLVIWSASLVRADGEEKIRKELKANYAKIVKGFKKNDPAVWEGFLIPEFKLKLFNGSVQDRQWVVGYVRNNAKTFKVLKLSMVIKELKIERDDATAVVEQKSSRTFTDEKGNTHRLDVGALQRETWTRTPDGWRLKSVEEWKVLYLLKDGRP